MLNSKLFFLYECKCLSNLQCWFFAVESHMPGILSWWICIKRNSLWNFSRCNFVVEVKWFSSTFYNSRSRNDYSVSHESPPIQLNLPIRSDLFPNRHTWNTSSITIHGIVLLRSLSNWANTFLHRLLCRGLPLLPQHHSLYNSVSVFSLLKIVPRLELKQMQQSILFHHKLFITAYLP